MSRSGRWIPVLAALLFVGGSAIEVVADPATPSPWCWLLGSLLFLLDAARRLRGA